MTMQEGLLFLIYLFLPVLIALRFLLPDRGRVARRIQVGKAMTIGDRQVQEDNYGMCQTGEGFLAVLADGMGKGYGGKAASSLVVNTFRELFLDYRSVENPAYFLGKAFRLANTRILEQLEERQAGVCAAAVLIRDRRLYYALAGNVKVALFRGDSLIPLSSGHTIDRLAEDRYRQGRITRESALRLLEKKRLYNYLGQDGFQEIEFFDTPIPLQPKDVVVLMSDGLYEGLSWKRIEAVLEEKGSCQQKAFALVEAINTTQSLHKDNASVVLVEAAA